MESPAQFRTAALASRRRACRPAAASGSQCQSIRVTLRDRRAGGRPDSLDHEATWLLGHTAQIDFLELWEGEGDLYVDAVAPRPLSLSAPGGRPGPMPGARLRGARAPGARGASRSRCSSAATASWSSTDCRNAVLRASASPRARCRCSRTAPVARATTPAPRPRAAPPTTPAKPPAAVTCRSRSCAPGPSADWRRWCVRAARRISARSSGPATTSLEVEMISACGYLEGDGVSCSLHGRHRADGRTAKPDLCFEWPPKNRGLHPGCVFAPRRRRGRG